MGMRVIPAVDPHPATLTLECDAPACAFVQSFTGIGFIAHYTTALAAGWMEHPGGIFLCPLCSQGLRLKHR